MTRPMTTEELFGKINSILEEKGRMPDILDYSHVTCKPVPIWTYEFDLKSSLYYGANEGIYLELWIEYFEGGGEGSAGLGAFKTLREDDEAMHTMASLLADFIIEEYAYVNANPDDFTWEGANVRVFNGKGEKMPWAYAYNGEEVEKAKKEHRKPELLPKISAHNLRHTACSNMAKQGMNIKVLQYLMGHAHSDVTMDVYNHIASKQDIKEEVERYARAAGN